MIKILERLRYRRKHAFAASVLITIDQYVKNRKNQKGILEAFEGIPESWLAS